MKVVLFCGGMGMRLREYSDVIPKPMIDIGYRPLVWHVMKYYAHYGHTDFILCLGYRGDVIKHYFLNYDECLSNDFVLTNGGRERELRGRDIQDWRITFVDTGLNANIGQRLQAVEPYLAGDDWFMANYADGLTDLPLPAYLAAVRERDRIASFLCVRPNQTFHVVSLGPDGFVSGIRHVAEAGVWINGGFFVFKRDIFRYIEDGEELVEAPFRRLLAAGQLVGQRYEGFWACMDTFKDKQRFDAMYASGDTPWQVWRTPRTAARRVGVEPAPSAA
jgi:glucose-1-phosphate cytidylyltransferase